MIILMIIQLAASRISLFISQDKRVVTFVEIKWTWFLIETVSWLCDMCAHYTDRNVEGVDRSNEWSMNAIIMCALMCGGRSWILMRGLVGIATRIATRLFMPTLRSLSVSFLGRSCTRERIRVPISAVPGNWVVPKLTMRKATGNHNRSSTVGSYESILRDSNTRSSHVNSWGSARTVGRRRNKVLASGLIVLRWLIALVTIIITYVRMITTLSNHTLLLILQ